MRRVMKEGSPKASEVTVVAWSDVPPDPLLHDQACLIVVACPLVNVRSIVVGSFLLFIGESTRGVPECEGVIFDVVHEGVRVLFVVSDVVVYLGVSREFRIPHGMVVVDVPCHEYVGCKA